jgi:hypothetical protein
MLCMPIWNKLGVAIGVAQMLNKRDGGGFSIRDKSGLGAFTAQLSIALENAQLFEDVNDAANAIHVANEMIRVLNTLNLERKKLGKPKFVSAPA